MKLHTDKAMVERAGTRDEREATIKATAKAFAILSSGLYSDKILAPVRELCCNAYDAHVAAGKADVPIEVQLPTQLNPIFSVKDFGTGLSHDRILELYLTYFESTKTDSNDYIGALGLGTKSPLAYTTAFTIESRFNGQKRLYTCYINENGTPAITEMADPVDTDEPNGLTVSFKVRDADIYNFQIAANKALRYFVPTPKVTPTHQFHTTPPAYSTKGNRWALRKDDTKTAQVVQGFIPYPVSLDILRDNGLSKAGQSAAQLPVDIFVDIGEVEMAPSREALSYDKRTVQVLVKRLESIGDEYYAAQQAEFDACKTMWEATQLFNDITAASNARSSLVSSLHHKKAFQYKGVNLHAMTGLGSTLVKSTNLFVYTVTNHLKRAEMSGKWIVKEQENSEFSFQPQYNTFVLVDDAHVSLSNLCKAHGKKWLSTSSMSRVRFLVLRPVKKSEFDQAEIDKILTVLGNPEYELTSSLNYKAVRTTSTYKARPKDQALQFTSFPSKKYGDMYTFSRLTWNTVTVDFEEGGYYMPIHRFTPIVENVNLHLLNDFLDAAVRRGFVDKRDSVVALTEKQIAVIANDDNWVNVFDHVQECLAKDEKERLEVYEHMGVYVEAGAGLHQLAQYATMVSECADPDMQALFEVIMEGKQAFQNMRNTEREDNNCLYGFFRQADKLYAAINKGKNKVVVWNHLAARYPLLSLLNFDLLRSDVNAAKVMDYINGCHRLLSMKQAA